MFKFIEDKRFFYICAALSVVVCALASNLLAHSIVSIFGNALTIIFLLAMMMFHNVEHKELMKVLTASFLQTIIMRNVSEYSGLWAQAIENATGKVTLTFRSISLIITTILLLIIFINHFIINFNGKAHRHAINVNKVVMVLYTVLIIVVKVALAINIYRNFPLFNSLSSKLKLALYLDGIPTLLYCLTVVSMEAFVNREREIKNKKVLNIVSEKIKAIEKTKKAKIAKITKKSKKSK